MGELINDINIAEKAFNNLGGRPISAPWRFDSEGNLITEKPTRHDCRINYYKNSNVERFSVVYVIEI